MADMDVLSKERFEADADIIPLLFRGKDCSMNGGGIQSFNPLPHGLIRSPAPFLVVLSQS